MKTNSCLLPHVLALVGTMGMGWMGLLSTSSCATGDAIPGFGEEGGASVGKAGSNNSGGANPDGGAGVSSDAAASGGGSGGASNSGRLADGTAGGGSSGAGGGGDSGSDGSRDSGMTVIGDSGFDGGRDSGMTVIADSGMAGGGDSSVAPDGSFDLTAMQFVKNMGIGWNLGNTMDAATETADGNPLTTQAMIQAVAAAGFKSIRIPVTWKGHFGAAPGYVIDPTWMNRVQQIVDWAQAAGLYAMINMHHDGLDGGFGWIEGAATDPTGVIAEYRALWAQIAQRFGSYSDHLVFESMNEVGFHSLEVNGAPTPAAIALLNQINGAFVSLVRASGGNNAQRYLLLAGYWTDTTRSMGVLMPDGHCILSVHYYTPTSFAFGSTTTTWGSAAEIASMQSDWAKVKSNYLDKGVPVILGEYGVVQSADSASRIFWLEYMTKITFDYGIAPFVWDDGGGMGLFNRRALTWPTGYLDAFKRASSGLVYTPVKG